jgi:hypothetical protein
MTKPLKFYQTLNQAPRSAKQHGKHRRAGAPAYGSSAFRTDHGARRADQGGATWVSWGSAFTIDFAREEPKPPAIPYAGIRTGELIGYRGWLVLERHDLSSVAHQFVWKPGEIVEGKISECVAGSAFWSDPIFGGTYSFFDASECEKQFSGVDSSKFPADCYVGHSFTRVLGIAFGTIKMWGEVIEHELGYRAQFARLHSIDRVVGAVDLEALRAKYGPPELCSNGQ